MNVIILTGNLVKQELRYNKSGTPICNGTIAVRRDYKNQQGEYETDFHNYVVIGKLGEVIANHVNKGDKFGIKGKLQNRVWEKDNGEKKYFTEVLVDGFDFPSKPSNSGGNTNTSNSNRDANTSNPLTNNDPFANNGGETNQFDPGDLPF